MLPPRSILPPRSTSFPRHISRRAGKDDAIGPPTRLTPLIVFESNHPLHCCFTTDSAAMPTLRYVDTESVSQGGGEPKDQVPRQRRPVDTNHKAGTTVAVAASSRNAVTDANQIPHQRRPVDASHGAGSAVGAAAAPSARGAAAGPAATSTALKSRKQSLGRKGGTNNTAPAPNPTPPSSSNTSPAKSGRSSRPVAPTKKIRRSCSMPNCIKPSQGPRYNHMCKIHMAADSTGASSASASHFKGNSDRTHHPPRPPRQQKTAFKSSRGPAPEADRDTDQKIPPSLPPPLQSSFKAATGKNPISFLFKLHDMLDDASSGDPHLYVQVPGAPGGEKLSDIVSYSSSGLAFRIRSEIDFRSCVLPLCFGKASYLTFKRVVNHCECIMFVGHVWGGIGLVLAVGGGIVPSHVCVCNFLSNACLLLPFSRSKLIDRWFRAPNQGAGQGMLFSCIFPSKSQTFGPPHQAGEAY